MGRGRAARAGSARAANRNVLPPNCITSCGNSFRERRVSDPAYRELADLWEAVFGEQPSVVAEPSLLAEILVAYLPRIEPYRLDAEEAPAAAPKPPGS